MITQPLMKDGSTGIKNSPTAMAAMVNDVIEKSDVLKNALGDTRADGEDPSSSHRCRHAADEWPGNGRKTGNKTCGHEMSVHVRLYRRRHLPSRGP